MVVIVGCGGGSSLSDDAAKTAADLMVTASGKVTTLSGNPLHGVTIEGVLSDPGSQLNPTTTSDADGNFSMGVFKGSTVYLRVSLANYATMNSSKEALNAGKSDYNIEMPTLVEEQDIINLAFTVSTPNFADKAWLAVDVVSAADGSDLLGKTIGATLFAAEVYLDCNGAPGTTVTVANCTSRFTPMYMAYFDAGSEVAITVGAESQTVVLRIGEVSTRLSK